MARSTQIRVAVVGGTSVVSRLRKQMCSTSGLIYAGHRIDAAHAAAEIERLNPAVVLLSESTGDQEILDLIRDLRRRWPNLPVIVLSKKLVPLRLLLYLAGGVRGIILENTDAKGLQQALDLVRAGGVAFGPEAQQLFADLLRRVVAPLLFESQLTAREKEVLLLLIEGCAYKDIAEKLNKSVNTVHAQVLKLYTKLGVHSRKYLLSSGGGGDRSPDA